LLVALLGFVVVAAVLRDQPELMDPRSAQLGGVREAGEDVVDEVRFVVP
jgi:hypothetical protein